MQRLGRSLFPQCRVPTRRGFAYASALAVRDMRWANTTTPRMTDTKTRGEEKRKRRDFGDILNDLKRACREGELPKAMKLANTLFQANVSIPRAEFNLLADSLRSFSRTQTLSDRPLLKPYVMELFHANQQGKCEPYPHASCSIMLYFLESRQYHQGLEIWSWLKDQSLDYWYPECSALAIRMLAESSDGQELFNVMRYLSRP